MWFYALKPISIRFYTILQKPKFRKTQKMSSRTANALPPKCNAKRTGSVGQTNGKWPSKGGDITEPVKGKGIANVMHSDMLP